MLPAVKGCVGLWRSDQHLGTLGGFRAVCGLCGQRLTREFYRGISRGKTVQWANLAAAFGGKSGDFGLPKKVLDKGPPW